MNIHGLGTDIVNTERFKIILNKKISFKKRIFTNNEINYCKRKKNSMSCYALRFAAKEAFSKALGTGIAEGISFKEIEIIKNKTGKPSIKLIGKTLLATQRHLKRKKFKFFLSISDDKPFAIASVIIAYK